jgi:hypothetical protein
MVVDHWTADQAFAEMQKFRFGAAFLHPEFKQFVYAFRPGSAALQPLDVAVSGRGQ